MFDIGEYRCYPDFLCRSSHQRCSIKKGVLRNFTKFKGKQLCQSLFFKKVVGLRHATLVKKRLWHRCFPVNFVKFLRIPFLQNTSGRLLLSLVKQSGKAKSILKIWQRNIWAILDHYSSTMDRPNHDKCPKRENSWCAYQRHISTGQRPAKWSLTKAIVYVLNPSFIRLTNEGFLDRYKQGSTQNSNESFNLLV